METESLDEEQPERHAEHGNHCPGKKLSSAGITKAGKSSESESAEISKRAQTAHRNRTDLRVTAAQHLKTVGRSAANCCFARQINSSEISSFSQAEQRNQSSRGVENCLGARAVHCRSCGLILAGLHEEGLAFLSAASTRAATSSGFDLGPGTASLLIKIVGVVFTPIPAPRSRSSSTCC